MHLRLVSGRRLSIAAAATALLSLFGVATATTAQASAPQILTYANKCLDVPGGQTAQGLRLQQWTCNGTVSQQFSIVSTGNGQVTIHIPFENKCVDVSGAHTQDGTFIDQWACNNTVAQNFTIVPLSDGRVNIRTFANKCVDVQSGSSADGAWIREWTCNNTIAQEFSL